MHTISIKWQHSWGTLSGKHPFPPLVHPSAMCHSLLGAYYRGNIHFCRMYTHQPCVTRFLGHTIGETSISASCTPINHVSLASWGTLSGKHPFPPHVHSSTMCHSLLGAHYRGNINFCLMYTHQPCVTRFLGHTIGETSISASCTPINHVSLASWGTLSGKHPFPPHVHSSTMCHSLLGAHYRGNINFCLMYTHQPCVTRFLGHTIGETSISASCTLINHVSLASWGTLSGETSISASCTPINHVSLASWGTLSGKHQFLPHVHPSTMCHSLLGAHYRGNIHFRLMYTHQPCVTRFLGHTIGETSISASCTPINHVSLASWGTLSGKHQFLPHVHPSTMCHSLLGAHYRGNIHFRLMYTHQPCVTRFLGHTIGETSISASCTPINHVSLLGHTIGETSIYASCTPINHVSLAFSFHTQRKHYRNIHNVRLHVSVLVISVHYVFRSL